mmetsp:Transcript_46429/g.122642  ORF Transcript_46429/g.122642 Transcript_46429/m.122642 type:complete len:208 (-) Transcript_46429:37-660(-)
MPVRSQKRSASLLHSRLATVAHKPLHAVLQTVALLCAARLDSPGAVLNRCEVEGLGNLIGGRGLQEVLLVGEDEQRDGGELVLREQFTKLRAALFQAAAVGRVDDVDEGIRGLEVVAPIRANSLLTSNVPDVEFETLMHQALDVEALRWHDVRNVLFGQLLQNRRLARVVKAEHEDTGLLLILLHLLQNAEQSHRVDKKGLSGRGGE